MPAGRALGPWIPGWVALIVIIVLGILAGMNVHNAVAVAASALSLLLAGVTFAFIVIGSWRRSERGRAARERAAAREADLRKAYEAERHTVDTLQRVFSQRSLPTVAQLRFSAMYEPAGEEARVGGDWYDAFELSGGRTLVVVGDIAGHGLEAAVAMLKFRDEVVAAALYDLDVDAMLVRINTAVFAPASSTPFATAIVGIVDTAAGSFRYAAAGHPPPAILVPGQAARLLPVGGLPLGALPNPVYHPIDVRMQRGTLIVLYTDGATEYGHNLVAGEARLLQAIETIGPHGDPARHIYRQIFRDAGPSDDVAILTVAFEPPAAGKVVPAIEALPSLVHR